MIATALVLALMLNPSQDSALVERYKFWDTAYLNHDVPAMSKVLHPDFVLVTGSGGKQTRSEYIQRLWNSVMPNLYSTQILKVDSDGADLIAFTIETSQKPGGVTDSHEYQDTWRRKNGNWLMVESRTVGDH